MKPRRELSRKALHLLSLVAPFAYAFGVSRGALLLALSLATLFALGVEIARFAHERTRRLFMGAVGLLLRNHEMTRWTGATWLMIALLLAVALYPRDVAIAAMWSVSAGDAAAAIAGVGWAGLRGRRVSGGKTLAGSGACLLASAAGAMMLAGLSVGESVAAGAVAAVAERPSGPLDDNLRVVLAVGVGILLWRMALS